MKSRVVYFVFLFWVVRVGFCWQGWGGKDSTGSMVYKCIGIDRILSPEGDWITAVFVGPVSVMTGYVGWVGRFFEFRRVV